MQHFQIASYNKNGRKESSSHYIFNFQIEKILWKMEKMPEQSNSSFFDNIFQMSTANALKVVCKKSAADTFENIQAKTFNILLNLSIIIEILLKKEKLLFKLLIMSISFFCYNVLKRHLLQMCQNLLASRKGICHSSVVTLRNKD